METGELFEWEYYALVKIIQRVLDKNHEKDLASFEAQGHAAGLNAEPESLAAFACAFSDKAADGARPPTQDKQKTEKSRRLLFAVNNKEGNALLFSVFCLLRLKRSGTDRSRRD